ncbi:MAG: hypothetical protein HUU35_04290 [Armatimonadetes bacterium]|nr:hypothetical protein [Armatimonadota bacterium]
MRCGLGALLALSLLSGCRGPAGPAPAQFQWTATPALELIPRQPLRGEAVGRPFQPQEVRFEPGPAGWRLVVAAADGAFLVLDLPGSARAGRRWIRPLAYGGGYWQVASPEDPAKLVTWTSDNAWVLALDSWSAAPWRPEGPQEQAAGRASGRLAVCYEGGLGGFGNSWVAGEFRNARVRYLGRPAWH